MSRDRLFEHYQQFVNDNIHLRNKAFIVLSAALKLYDANGATEPDKIFSQLDFGLKVLILTQEQL